MNSTIIVIVLVVYFGLLYFISRATGKNDGNDAFFVGERQSAWYLVAFGMIGASLSGVTFISIPPLLILLSSSVDRDQCLDDRQHNKLRFEVEWYR